MKQIQGGCYCGNIDVKATLAEDPTSYRPRACDCYFCLKHGAAYVSDPNGQFEITIRTPTKSTFFRQGSESARFLICTECGVLTCVLFEDLDQTFGAINARAVSGGISFGEPLTVSPKKLSASEKKSRWQDVWFKRVEIRK